MPPVNPRPSMPGIFFGVRSDCLWNVAGSARLWPKNPVRETDAEAVGGETVIMLAHGSGCAVVGGRPGERRPDLVLIIAPERDSRGYTKLKGSTGRPGKVAALE